VDVVVADAVNQFVGGSIHSTCTLSPRMPHMRAHSNLGYGGALALRERFADA
jgi:hypothetical protein